MKSSRKSVIKERLAAIAGRLKATRSVVRNGFSRSFISARNRIRRWRKIEIDYVLLPISGSLPQRLQPLRSRFQRFLPWQARPSLTFQQLNYQLERIAEADNTKGALLILRGLNGGLATLQNLRRSIERLQQAGKRVAVYTATLDLPHYFVASAANQIIIPPSAQFDLLGLFSSRLFLRDSLALAGIELEIVNVSPYKSSFDQLGQSQMSPELRQMVEWLLDEQYEQIIAGISAGRSLDPDQVKALIDNAPYTAEEMAENRLIDHIAYDDQLGELLGSEENPAKIVRWSKARRRLLEQFRPATEKLIGVIGLHGTIMMGSSRSAPDELPIPIVGGATAGHDSLARQFKIAQEIDQLAGLIFLVDSGGGSALASDLIMRHAQRLGEKLPILAYMGDIAASGGYYVSAPADHIMAQDGTVTGSIGVITARPNTIGLLDKLKARQESLQRGKRANLYVGNAPLTDEERQIFREGINKSYQRFKQIVSEGRDLPIEQLDPICNGRVWMGSQAMRHELVDSTGDFVDAVAKIAEMAEMPAGSHRIATVDIFAKTRGYTLPPQSETGASLVQLLTGERIRQLFNGKPLALMPFDFKLW